MAARDEAHPLNAFKWLPPQHAYLNCPDKRKLLRAGNQSFGKTTAGLADLIWRCTDTHPFLPVRPGPKTYWVLCASWKQSLAIQGKMWDLVPKDRLHHEQKYDPVRGFPGHTPALRFDDGSIIFIKTTQQGALNLSSATIDGALFDEPPASQRVYSEVVKRVQKRNGFVFMTLTPINAPIDWLEEACEKGQITDLHFRLEAENLIPVGESEPIRLDDGTPCDEAWIAGIRAETFDHEAPVILDGEWRSAALGQLFTAFRTAGAGSHVLPYDAELDYTICLGFDHGHKKHTQVAVLSGVIDDGEYPSVHIMDEHLADEYTPPEVFAQSVLDLLARNGLRWEDVDHAFGDRVHGAKGSLERRGNLDIEREVAKLLRLRDYRHLQPRIHTVKRGRGAGAGSVRIGERWLHHQMLRPGNFYIDPACEKTIESFEKYEGDPDSEFKHLIDGVRYGLWHHIRRGPTRTAGYTPKLKVF